MKFLKDLLPKSLVPKVLLILIIPILFLQILLLFVFYQRHWLDIEHRLSNINAGNISIISELWLDGHYNNTKLETIIKRTLGLHVTITKHANNGSNQALPAMFKKKFNHNSTEQLFVDNVRSRIQLPFIVDNQQSYRYRYIYLYSDGYIMKIELAYKLLFSSTIYVFIIFMIASSIIIIGVVSMFLKNQLRPIKLLAQAADDVGKGRHIDEDSNYYIPIKGASEIQQATRAFNNMIERVHRQIRQRTDMLSGVSHDLRTPLTRIRLQVAMLQQTPETQRLKNNISNMERMIEGYLAFAKGNNAEPSTDIDMYYFITKHCDEWKKNGLALDYHVEDRFKARVRPNALQRMLDNIIQNAHHYSSHIWLSLAKRDNNIQIIIDDDGCGIDPSEYEQIFRPFYRIEKSRNTKTGGVGLGMTIALDVARSHGGDIILDASPQGGLRVRILIPL